MAAPTDRVFDFDPSSKVSTVKDFEPDGMFWERLQTIEPILKLINMVVTFLEGDSIPISFGLLSLTLIYEAVKKLSLASDLINHMRASFRKRYKTTCSDIHTLSLVLNPLSHVSGGMMSNFSFKEKNTSL